MGSVNPGSVDWTAVYEALSDGRRRDLLDTLHRTDDRVPVEELAARFLYEYEQSNVEHSRDVVELRLRHVHLPKLQHAGLVEWDREAAEVTLTPLGGELPVEFLRPSMIGGMNTGATTSGNVGD
jgi:DNA-binding transcriptional ArsR family regulator